MKMKRIAPLFFLLPLGAAAQDISVSPLIGMKGHYGGDALATIYYTDGSDQDLAAGQGINFYAGAKLNAAPFEMKGSVGYKYATSAATNISVAKTALPIELTGRFKLNNGLFAGAGLTMHLNPQLDLGGMVTEYDASPGFHLEAGWRALSLGWTSLTYSAGSTQFDASSFDINLEWAF